MTVHHVDVQDARAAALDSFDLVAKTGKVCGQNRRGDIDVAIPVHEILSSVSVWAEAPDDYCSLLLVGC